MSINYPTSIDNGSSLPNPSATNDTNSPSLSSGQVLQNSAVIALETKLGINSSTASTNTVLLGTGSGASTWGTLTSSYVTAATGSGSFVFATSPTITSATLTTPTINNPTLNTDSVVGFTTSNNGTVYGISVSGGKIGTAAIGNNAVLSGQLGLSNSYSGGVASQANAGTAGGTFYYINLGGLKLLWCLSSTGLSTSTSGNSYTFTLPTFFSTVQHIVVGVAAQATQAGQNVSADSFSTTSVTAKAVSPGGNATAQLTLFMVGT